MDVVDILVKRVSIAYFDVFIADGGTSALGMDNGAGGNVSSSLTSVPELRRPVTAQERQREREEKRRKRQERAREREKKLKEKERREGKHGDSLGGVLLSDDDKSLLERWKKMMDSCNDKSQTPNNDGPKTKDCNVNLHHGVAMSDNTQVAMSKNTDKEVGKIQSHEQLMPQGKSNLPGLFQPPNTQGSLPYSMSQTKPPADISVGAVSRGIDIMPAASGFVKNTLKPHESGGQSGFNCLGNWNGQQVEARPMQQQPQPNRSPQPPSASFLQPQLQPQSQPQSQPQPNPQPQSQLLPLETFLTKAPTLSTGETNGNVDVRGQNNLNSHPNPSTTSPGPMEKLCPSIGEKSGPQTADPLCGALGVPSQPHPSLGFTDTGQPGPSIAPDIHTVTLQLSKSQVRLRFLFTWFVSSSVCFVGRLFHLSFYLISCDYKWGRQCLVFPLLQLIIWLLLF